MFTKGKDNVNREKRKAGNGVFRLLYLRRHPFDAFYSSFFNTTSITPFLLLSVVYFATADDSFRT